MTENYSNDQVMRSEIRRLDTRIDDTREYFKARVDEVGEAADTALVANNHRLDEMNGFRRAMEDQATKFVRSEVFVRMEADIRDLREEAAKAAGKASAVSVYWAFAVSLAGLILGFINYLSK